MVQMKGTYMVKDLTRLAQFYQIPINVPAVSNAQLILCL